MNESQIKQINDSLRVLSDYCKTRRYCTPDYSDNGRSGCPFYAFCHKNFYTEPESWLLQDWFKEEYQ